MIAPTEELLGSKYELLGKIAEGGMGAIYKARHRLLDEVRVIKTLRADTADRDSMRQRFQQEARTAIRLKHPGIAQLHDFTVAADGTGFIIMEFIDGVALDRVLAECTRLSAGAAVRIGLQALEALDYLHAQGFVHRDISPDNLMLCRGFDGSTVVKLIDLGIAKDLGEKSGLTLTGTFLGKIRYCSPEHFSESRDVDLKGDLYSFGLILYEMVTGRHPIPGETFTQMAAGHLFQPPLDFAETDPESRVPSPLREVILRALAKDPEARHDSAAALAEALIALELPSSGVDEELDRVLDQAMAARPPLLSAGTTDMERLDDQFLVGEASGSLAGGKAVSSLLEPGQLNDGKTIRGVAPGNPPMPSVAPSATASRGGGAAPGARAGRPTFWLGLVAAVSLVVLFAGWLALRSAIRGRVAPTAEVAIEAPPSYRPGLASEAVGEPDEVAIAPAVLAQIDAPAEPASARPVVADSASTATSAGAVASVTEPTPVSGKETLPSPEPADSSQLSDDAGAAEAEDPAVARPAIAVNLEVLELRKKVDELPRALDDTFRRPAMAPPVLGRATLFDFDLQLGRDGAIIDIEPIGEPPDPAYSSALESVLYRTRFSPGMRKGDPVKGHFRARITVSPSNGS